MDSPVNCGNQVYSNACCFNSSFFLSITSRSNAVLSSGTVSQNSDSDTIKIFVIAKQSIYVDGLVRVISDNEGHEVVACKEPDDNYFHAFSNNPADILLIEQSIIETQIKRHSVDGLFSKFLDGFPGLRIVIFGHNISESFVKLLVKASVRGFIDINSTHDALITAIDEVYNGGYWINRNALQDLVKSAVDMDEIIELGIRKKLSW